MKELKFRFKNSKENNTVVKDCELYTNIKDINGKLICEGDICKVKYYNEVTGEIGIELIRKVEFTGTTFLLTEDYNGTKLSSSLNMKNIAYIEVI